MEKGKQQKTMLKTYTTTHIHILYIARLLEHCNTITGEDIVGGGAILKRRYFTMYFLFFFFYFLSPSNSMENIYI